MSEENRSVGYPMNSGSSSLAARSSFRGPRKIARIALNTEVARAASGRQRLQAGDNGPDLVFQTVRESIEATCHPCHNDNGGYLNGRHDQNGHRNDPEKDFTHDMRP